MLSPRTVHLAIPGAEYDVLVAPGLLAEAGFRLSRLSRSRKAAIVTDSNVGPLYADQLEESLASAGFDVIRDSIPAGEANKNLATLATIYDQLLDGGVERSTPILALGGGVVGDMAGFAAATVLRGVPFAQVPTTLLAMVDASVGGKTGVDHPAGKNLIGAFYQPITVLIDPSVLKTLPPRDLRSGLAECIKHDIIRDERGFAHLEANTHRAAALDFDYLADLVAHNVAIKAAVVESDPRERGQRAHLNLGHTFGHAIETVSGFSYAHGEAVALGMIAAARCAHYLSMLPAEDVHRIRAVIDKVGLPTGQMSLDVDQIISTMSFDKKMRGGRLRFVLPDRIGHVIVRDDVPPDIVRRSLESLQG